MTAAAAPKPAPAKADAPATAPAKAASQPQTAAPAVNGHAGGRVFASPLARRLAKDGGLDLAIVKGSGPHGRIVAADVKTALANGVPAQKGTVADGGCAADARRVCRRR